MLDVEAGEQGRVDVFRMLGRGGLRNTHKAAAQAADCPPHDHMGPSRHSRRSHTCATSSPRGGTPTHTPKLHIPRKPQR